MKSLNLLISVFLVPLFSFLIFTIRFQDASAHGVKGVIVVSDIHIIYSQEDHLNNQVLRKAIEVWAQMEEVTDLIVNGDLFDGRSLGVIEEDSRRIQAQVDLLLQIQRETGKRVHFNIGNHDEKGGLSDDSPQVWVVDREYSDRLADAAEEAGILVIGRVPGEVYSYQIGHHRFQISHFPFCRTEETDIQAERIRDCNERAYDKVTNDSLEMVKAMKGFFLQGDSHTPLYDHEKGVFNTGKLAWFDATLDEPSTFLVIEKDGTTKMFKIDLDGRLSRFDIDEDCTRHLS